MKLPDADALIEFHAESIESFGGAPGLRDRGALEASLARADHILAYAGDDPDAVDVACAVCASLCRNHAFVDGNKRIALIALGVVLELNGFYLDAREHDAADIMMRLASGTLAEDALKSWVRANIAPQ
ncbi:MULTISPECIES: type II toxin-antitoxin system death-on-curing family toxin [Rhodomicrobium]|uniref:type II toxin-antitoxin system death-on-curing family toxin n=1 Tax=Rhodomicrobium TaxID=1068 RepID=UPI000B4A7921|nr:MULTISPECIES: type II toxin-antitoxin system death-on-curing family toxin [Rhodomicrobium]